MGIETAVPSLRYSKGCAKKRNRSGRLPRECHILKSRSNPSCQDSSVDPNRHVWPSTISYGVPALSFATGRNAVNAFGQTQNFDLMSYENGWPQARLSGPNSNRWFHGDAKDIAFPFNYPLWQQWVQLGGLK